MITQELKEKGSHCRGQGFNCFGCKDKEKCVEYMECENIHIKQERKIIFPAIYKHFLNKYYAAMGITETIEQNKFNELLDKPNIIFFTATNTEKHHSKVLVARHKKKFYTISNEIFVLYKPLYCGEKIYATPLEIFNSEVDKDKNINIEQKYIFELIKY